MSKLRAEIVAGTLLAFVCQTASQAADTPASKPANSEKPNIVLILADDMGYSDLSCYGSEIPTPNLDALAAGGLRFTQFYNTARCSPTRASLLTGLHPHQAGVGALAGVKKPDPAMPEGYRGVLSQRCMTLAEVLHTAGYHTYISGKWNLGHSDHGNGPLQRGFERFFGILQGAASYLQPNCLFIDNSRAPSPKNVGTGPNDYYITDAFTDFGMQAVQEQQDNAPFFLYLAYTAPHWPLQAKAEDIAKFTGKYRAGWDKLRAERYARQIQLGITAKDYQLSARDDGARAWDALSEQEKTDLDYRMAVYAAQVHRMDWNIGRLVDALRQQKKLDNTLFLFLSDNGASAEPYSDLGGGQQSDINEPAWRGDVSYGTGWANLSNTPFRRYKSKLEEGGIATPLIVHWPAGLKTKAGQITDTPGYLLDILPTLLEVSGAKYPDERNGQTLFPLEGRNLLAASVDPTPRLFFWEHTGNRSVRLGDWKAIRQEKKNSQWELYNLARDRTELRNVAAEHPEMVKDLATQWEGWAVRAQVLPYPGRGEKITE